MILKRLMLVSLLGAVLGANAQDEMWDKSASGRQHPNIQWFKEAKFGMFIHWACIPNWAAYGTISGIMGAGNG